MKPRTPLSVGVLIIATLGCGGSKSGQPDPAASVARDIEQLTSPDGEVRGKAIRALRSAQREDLERHTDRLNALLEEEDPDVRTSVALLLARVGRGEAALPALIEGLDRRERRAEVVDALSRMGHKAKPAVGRLLEVYKEEDIFLRMEVADAVDRIDEKKGGPLLVDVVTDPRAAAGNQYTYLAMRALGSQGVGPEDAPRLVEPVVDGLFHGPGVDVLGALMVLGPHARRAVPALEAIRVGWLEKSSFLLARGPFLRDRNQAAVERFFREAGCDVRKRDDGVEVSYPQALEAALKAVGPVDAAELREALKDKHEAVRVGAAFALVKADRESRRYATPTLIKVIIESKSPGVRWKAVEALGEIGPGAKEAVPVLSAMLNDSDIELRKSAFAALEKINKGK